MAEAVPAFADNSARLKGALQGKTPGKPGIFAGAKSDASTSAALQCQHCPNRLGSAAIPVDYPTFPARIWRGNG